VFDRPFCKASLGAFNAIYFIPLQSYSNVLFGAVLVAALSAFVASQSINVVVVGDLTRTQHRVSGRVYALNESMLILDEFTFDGLGAGVYLNVATQGNSRRQWVQSRTIIDYPSSFDARPIERPYLGVSCVSFPKFAKCLKRFAKMYNNFNIFFRSACLSSCLVTSWSPTSNG
jgi:hypothetical protein